jgi:hypothetical protein
VNGIVHCHSDFRYAEKPVSFEFTGDTYKIDRIVSEWKSVNGYQFTVLTEQKFIFQLLFDETQEQWLIKQINR